MHLHWSQILLIIKKRISLMLKPYLGCFSPLLPRFRDSINILFLCSSNLSDIIHRATSENYARICYFKVLVCQHSFCLFCCFCVPTVILIFPTAIFCLLLLLREISFFFDFLSLPMFHIHCFPMYTIKFTKCKESWINCLINFFYF